MIWGFFCVVFFLLSHLNSYVGPLSEHKQHLPTVFNIDVLKIMIPAYKTSSVLSLFNDYALITETAVLCPTGLVIGQRQLLQDWPKTLNKAAKCEF